MKNEYNITFLNRNGNLTKGVFTMAKQHEEMKGHDFVKESRDAKMRNHYSSRRMTEAELRKFADKWKELFDGEKVRGYLVPVKALKANMVFRCIGVRPGKFNIVAGLFKGNESTVVMDFAGFEGGVPAFEELTGMKMSDYGYAYSGYGCDYI